MAGQHGELRTRVHIPNARGLVKRRGDDARAVGRVRGEIDVVAMAGQHGELRIRARIPNARGLVLRRRDDAGAVGGIFGGINASAMAGQHGELRTRVRIPDARGFVHRRGDDAGAVGGVRGGIDAIAMAGQHGELGVGRADLLKHTNCGRRMSLRESRIREHFQDDALRARNIRILEPLGGCLGEQSRLSFQRLRRLILRFMLSLGRHPSGGRCDHRE